MRPLTAATDAGFGPTAEPSRHPNRWVLGALVVAAPAVALAEWLWMPNMGAAPGAYEMDAIAVLFVWAGVAAWVRRPGYRFGQLMVLTGAAWFVKLLVLAPNSLAFTLSYTWGNSFDPLIAYMALSFPTGRLANRPGARVFWSYVAWAYAVYPLASSMLSPRAIEGFPPGIDNLFSVHPIHISRDGLGPAWLGGLSGPAFLTVVVVFTLARWWRASRPGRRILAPALGPATFTMFVTAVFYVCLFVLPVIGQNLASGFDRLVSDIYWVSAASWAALPVGFLAGLYLERRGQARVGRLVVELDELPGMGPLEESLRRALRDPSLRVGFYDAASGTYQNAEGGPFDIGEDASHLVATRLERGGSPLGLMVHDRALLENPHLMDATAAAVRMAVDNDRLHAAVRAQLEEVRASRARIVEASDAERRRVERNLHDGAQQRLVSLAMSLRAATAKARDSGDPALVAELDHSAESLDRALVELRELAQGIHPAILDEGLRSALEELAETSTIPVRLSVDDDRHSPPVEATVYFLACEALANAAKHSRASSVSVRVNASDERLVVEISDDGTGGADPGNGSGLRGLQDRVAALGGTLEVDSPPGRGTRVRAEIPCALPSPTTPS